MKKIVYNNFDIFNYNIFTEVGEEMAQNKNTKNKKKESEKDLKKKGYKNPAKTAWGKILILILTAAMALASVAMLIYYIVISFR